MRPSRKMARYLRQGAAGEVRTLLQQWFDLPGRAESKVRPPDLEEFRMSQF
jgi:hypothetical protein